MPNAVEDFAWLDLLYVVPVLLLALAIAFGRFDLLVTPFLSAKEAVRAFKRRRLIRRLVRKRKIGDRFRGRRCLDAIVKETNASAEAFQATTFHVIPYPLFAEHAEYISGQLAAFVRAPSAQPDPWIARILGACRSDARKRS